MLALCLLLAVPVLAADKKTKTAKSPDADPPGLEALMAQYRGKFTAVDLDKDNYLDKEELAKAFRGKDAKPYDHNSADKSPAANSPGKDSESSKDLPKDKGKEPSQKGEESDKDKAAAKGKPRLTVDYSKFPDYQFLSQLDKDGDEKVSREEFELWAHDYALKQLEQQKQAEDQQKKVAALQAKMQQAALKEMKKMETELKKERDALIKLNQQIEAKQRSLMMQIAREREKERDRRR